MIFMKLFFWRSFHINVAINHYCFFLKNSKLTRLTRLMVVASSFCRSVLLEVCCCPQGLLPGVLISQALEFLGSSVVNPRRWMVRAGLSLLALRDEVLVLLLSIGTSGSVYDRL